MARHRCGSGAFQGQQVSIKSALAARCLPGPKPPWVQRELRVPGHCGYDLCRVASRTARRTPRRSCAHRHLRRHTGTGRAYRYTGSAHQLPLLHRRRCAPAAGHQRLQWCRLVRGIHCHHRPRLRPGGPTRRSSRPSPAWPGEMIAAALETRIALSPAATRPLAQRGLHPYVLDVDASRAGLVAYGEVDTPGGAASQSRLE
jgi:hypothetical protein